MSVAEREVSEGYPTDGRIFERPVESIDNEKPRYLTFLGNLIDRETMRQRHRPKAGGIEISNPCLRYVKDFLHKGRITPLIQDTHNFVPRDIVKVANENDTSYFSQPIPVGYQSPTGSPPLGGLSPLMGKIAHPGQQINSILTGPENIHNNMPRGVVELKTLAHQPYRPQLVEGGLFVDPVIWQIQRTIFPTFPLLPTLLDEIDAQLLAAWNHTDLREIVEEMQTSLIQFRSFATATVEQSHMNMREVASKTSGYIPQYTAMDLVLLEQLGMTRRDTEFRQMQQANQGGAQLGEIKELFSMFLEANREERQELIKAFERQAAPVVDENTMAAAPIDAGHDGYPGYPGQSGYSGFSGGEMEMSAAQRYERDVVHLGTDAAQKRVDAGEYGAGFQPHVVHDSVSGLAINPQAAMADAETEGDSRPLKGFAKINHDRRVAKEAAARAAAEKGE